jgi:hypothetical protein
MCKGVLIFSSRSRGYFFKYIYLGTQRASSGPPHTRTERHAPVWGSEFTTKAALSHGDSKELLPSLRVVGLNQVSAKTGNSKKTRRFVKKCPIWQPSHQNNSENREKTASGITKSYLRRSVAPVSLCSSPGTAEKREHATQPLVHSAFMFFS